MDYKREALALPGEQVFRMAALSFDVRNKEEIQHLFGELGKNEHLTEEESHYMPPKMVNGKIQGAVTVSEGTLIVEEDTHSSETLESEPHCEEAEDKCDHAQVEVSEAEETRGLNLADEQYHPLVSVEVEGDMQGGSTDSGKEGECEV